MNEIFGTNLTVVLSIEMDASCSHADSHHFYGREIDHENQ